MSDRNGKHEPGADMKRFERAEPGRYQHTPDQAKQEARLQL